MKNIITGEELTRVLKQRRACMARTDEDMLKDRYKGELLYKVAKPADRFLNRLKMLRMECECRDNQELINQLPY